MLPKIQELRINLHPRRPTKPNLTILEIKIHRRQPHNPKKPLKNNLSRQEEKPPVPTIRPTSQLHDLHRPEPLYPKIGDNICEFCAAGGRWRR